MKRKKRQYKPLWNIDNQGVSLLELLVSIIILILIMIPVMGNFIRSMELDSKAEELQDYSTAAANILEDMKPLGFDEMLTKYQTMRLTKNPDNTYRMDTGTLDPQDTYYFGITSITPDDTLYDALITVSAEKYNYTAGDTEHGGTLLNNYPMPDITTVNENKNGMFFSNMYKDITTNVLAATEDPLSSGDKSLDLIALDYFQAAGETYANEQFKAYSVYYADYLQQLKAIQNGIALPTIPAEPNRSADPAYANPDYCNPEVISDLVTRTSDIQIDDVEVTTGKYCTVINYKITYFCAWSELGSMNIADTITYQVEYKQYDSLINNIYLYYQTSRFQQYDVLHPDVINLSNNCSKTMNFYLVKQESDATNPSVSIHQSGVEEINIYTNMADDKVDIEGVEEASEKVNNDIIVTSPPENRIYSIQVEIFRYTEALDEKYKDQDKLYSLESNRQN